MGLRFFEAEDALYTRMYIALGEIQANSRQTDNVVHSVVLM